jgi:outer membrane cobalamin receptor
VSAQAGGGSQGTAFASASGGVRFGEGVTGARLTGTLSHRQTEGYSAKDPATNPGANPDRDGGRQSALSAQFEQGWGEGHRTTVSLLLDRTRSDYDSFVAGQDDRLTSRVDSLFLQSPTRWPQAGLASTWAATASASMIDRFRDRWRGATRRSLQLQWQALARHACSSASTHGAAFTDSNAADDSNRPPRRAGRLARPFRSGRRRGRVQAAAPRRQRCLRQRHRPGRSARRAGR